MQKLEGINFKKKVLYCNCKVSYCKLYNLPRLAMLYAGCVNLKNLPNLNFNKMMMMMMMMFYRLED